MTDAEATIRSAIINGLGMHCEETGLRLGKTTDMLTEDLVKAIFDAPVRWAVVSYAGECDDAALSAGPDEGDGSS